MDRMTENNNISPIHSDFKQIKKSTEGRQKYYLSRNLYDALRYSTYQKFSLILNKAIAVAK